MVWFPLTYVYGKLEYGNSPFNQFVVRLKSKEHLQEVAKKFAVWARTELIARVSLKGVEYGITEDKIEDANADSVGGKVLTADEKEAASGFDC